MTLYDWSLLVHKVNRIQEKEFEQRKFELEVWGNWMALFANANRAKNQPAFTREDFYNFDGVKIEEKADPEKIKNNVEKILKDRKRG